MRAFPPLNATRAFAVAARCGSFAVAAAELGVTAAAVSRHVRNLEVHLAKQLFQRHGNRVALTEAGQSLYPRLEALLGGLVDLTDEVRTRSGRARLTVSASPSLAEYWLYPRLQGFDLSGVDIRAELDPVDFAANRIDLRLTYGMDHYPEHARARLHADRVVPVSAPGFCTAERVFPQIADRWLIHTDWGPAWMDTPSWRAWFTAAGFPREAAPSSGLRTHLTSHALAAALNGLGVALAPSRLAEAEIARGRLEIASPVDLAMDGVYSAIWPHSRSGSRSLTDLLLHLGITTGP
jgi:LysR family transcriptional regulator, glycine cleavage system transcriptional activator